MNSAHGRVLFVLVCFAAFASGALAQYGGPTPTLNTGNTAPVAATAPVVPPDLRAKLIQQLHVGTVDLLPLQVDTTPSRAVRLTVALDGMPFTLNLLPFSVRAESYQVIEHRADGSYVPVKPTPVNTLRGWVEEVPGALAAGGVMEDGLYAQVILSDDVRYWIQPARSVIPDSPAGLHVVYHNADCTDFSARCTTETIPDPTFVPGGPVLRGGTQRWQALAAFDAEFQFYRQTGSTARSTDMINLVMNVVNVQYEREVDIRHLIGTIIVRTFQNYNPSDPMRNMRQQFQEWWNANHGNVSRDIAIMFDGNGNGGQTAAGAAICNLSTAYSACGVDWANLSYRTDVVAHEVGHAWSSCHCPCTSPPYTMDPIINYANRFEGAPQNECSSNTVAQIINHRNNRPGGCLDIVFAGTVLPNDNCANATYVPCSTADPSGVCAFGFRNIGATMDGPGPGCRYGASDIWYRYVAACDGVLTVNTCFSSFDTLLFAYASSAPCPPAPTDQIACNDDDASACPGDGRASKITFNVVRGQSYLVRIAGYGGAQGTGVVGFSNTGCNAPANDFCSNATAVGQAVDIPFTTVNATTGQEIDAGFNRPVDSWLESPCVNGVGDDLQITNDIWFRYVAPCSGSSRFSLCNSSFDTKIAVYDHCPTGDNQRLICNDDSCGLQSSVDQYLNAGTAYLVRVGGYHGAMGAGVLHIDSFQCPPPANDNCATSNYGISDGYTANGTTYQGSRDGSASRGLDNGPDVWYWYRPECTGIATLDTCGSTSDTVVSVHTGCPGTIFNELAVDDDGCGYPASRVSFPCVAYQTYLVRVAAYSLASAGPFQLHSSCVPYPPANDACASAIDVSGCWSQNFYTLISATGDGSASCGASTGNPDVWFNYTAPRAGRLICATCGSNDMGGADLGIDTVMSLHSGCPGTTANEIACNDDSYDPDCYQVGIVRDSYIAYNIAAGENIKIRVSKYSSSPTGRFIFYTVLQPFNDTCAAAEAIAGNGPVQFCTIGAHTEYNRFPYPQGDIWYRWIAPCDGDATADLCGSDTNMRLVVYRDTGTCPADSNIQGYITTGFEGYYDQCTSFTGKATFSATAGQAYLIEIGNHSGEGVLNMSCAPNTGACCTGSHCQVVTAAWCASASGSFQGIGEPCKFPGNPVTCCPANINQSGGTTVQDIFDFLQLYFANDPRADINLSGAVSVQDIFDFLAAYFAGCN